MARHDGEYNWLDDPFNDSKSNEKMGGGSKAFVGIGCAVALVLIVVLVVVGIAGMFDVASSL